MTMSDLDTFGRIIARARLVDLSIRLAPELPSGWPGAIPFRHFVDHWFTEDANSVEVHLCGNNAPYRSHGMILDEHTGTHFDAPAHFLSPLGTGLPSDHEFGVITGDKVPPRQFFGPACVIDVTSLLDTTVDGISPRIEAVHIQEWEAENRPIVEGDVVLFRSGWDEHYLPGRGGRRYIEESIRHNSGPAWPAPDAGAVSYLVDRGVRCVGTDGASIGPADDGAATHQAGLSRGIVFIECVANLSALPSVGAYFLFLPIKVARSAGGPGRAIALVIDEPPS